MATATATPESTTPAGEPRIARPLSRLRQAIRIYVTVEGVALCATFACLWFWGTLLVDWGLFKLFGIDYLRDGSPAVVFFFRAIFLLSLTAVLALIVGYRIVYRLSAVFRGPALALVFERRFPKVLTDRLVTAVELGHPGAADRYGYSEAMIRETTQAAAERAGQLSIRQVLNWRRLAKRCGLAVVLFASVVALGIAATDTAAVWLERDLLLQKKYWPTETMLETLYAPKAVPHGGEARIGLRAWKWVVATNQTPEGWRPLRWDDLWIATPEGLAATPDTVPELQALASPKQYYETLPESWQTLPVDQVQVRVEAAAKAASALAIDPEVEAHLFELGAAVLNRVRRLRATGEARLDQATAQLLPAGWRTRSLDQLEEYFAAARQLTPAALSVSGQAWPAEGLQRQLAALSPLPVPVLTAAVVERVPDAPPLGLDPAQKEQLPAEWRNLTATALADRLHEFQPAGAAQRVGRAFVNQLAALFEELDERAGRTAYGRRRQFRKLEVPAKATVESEQILTAEEREFARPKFGTYVIRTQPDSYDFSYDFKKLERPVRFRVRANDAATPWRAIDLVPLPALKTLTRYQTEPGYLHGSSAPVTVGPFAVALEGEESRFDVRAGSLLRLEAESYKSLQWVRIIPEGQSALGLWSKLLGHSLAAPVWPQGAPGLDLAAAATATAYVENANPFVKKLTHQPGQPVFQVEFNEIAGQDVRLRFEFEDTDGIVAGRKLHVAAVQDQKPEFVHAGFEIVRREMITPQAIIPFSGRVRDEHALTDLAYEVRVVKVDGSVVETRRFPFRRFVPLRLAEGRPELRFEGRSQVTLPQVGASGRFALAGVHLSLGRLPLAGPIAFYQLPGFELTKEHPFELPVRADKDPLRDEDEYFDSLWLQPPVGADKLQNALPAPPYRLSISLVARDNFAGKDETGKTVAGQESRSPESFDFMGVIEEDLLIEAGRREEDLRDRFDAIITSLKSARKLLRNLQDDYEALRKENKPDDFRKAKADVEDALRALRDGHDLTDRDVARELRLIYKELALNRCREVVLKQLDEQICTPLEMVLRPGAHFARAVEEVGLLASRLGEERDQTPPALIRNALERTDQLIARLEEIMSQMRKLLEYNELLKVLRTIITDQTQLLEQLKKLHKEMMESELKGDVKPMKPAKP